MKRLTLFVVLFSVLALAGCQFLPNRAQPTSGSATLTDQEMATQISQILTAMPTPTQESKAIPTATPALPTVAPTTAPAVATATPQAAAPTATGVPEQPTATQAAAGGGGPTVAVTPMQPTATQPASGGGVPTVAVTPAQPSGPTPTLSADDPLKSLGNPSGTDNMDRADDWTWPSGYDQYSSVSWSNGLMTLTGLTEKLGWRLANPTGREFGSLYLEMTVKTNTCSGGDQYGFVLRSPVLREADRGYFYGITCDGRFSFRAWDGKVEPKGKMTWLKDWTASKAINTGSNQSNRLGVMMKGDRFGLYVNGVLVGEVKDSTYPTGWFGVYVGPRDTKEFSVQIDRMVYWTNP